MARDSGIAFKQFVMDQLCVATPLNERRNGVRLGIAAGRPRYAQCCVHRLLRDEMLRALEVLEDLFAQANPPVGSCAAWSLQAEAGGFVVGEVFVVEGGHQGRGELAMRIEKFGRGIFRSM